MVDKGGKKEGTRQRSVEQGVDLQTMSEPFLVSPILPVASMESRRT